LINGPTRIDCQELEEKDDFETNGNPSPNKTLVCKSKPLSKIELSFHKISAKIINFAYISTIFAIVLANLVFRKTAQKFE